MTRSCGSTIQYSGMPEVIVMKRGMAKGYSGVTNTLFDRANCKVLFGDAKESLLTIINELKRI